MAGLITSRIARCRAFTGRGAQEAERRRAANAGFAPGRGGQKWDSESQFSAGARRPRQPGPHAEDRREGRHPQALGQSDCERGCGGDQGKNRPRPRYAEELERKAAELENADKRQPAEPYVVPRKHIQLVIKRPTSPAKPEAAEAGSKFEEAWKAFDALGRKHQLRFIHDACLHVGFDPLEMAPRAEFGLADEEPELAEDRPADVVPAIDGDPVVQP